MNNVNTAKQASTGPGAGSVFQPSGGNQVSGRGGNKKNVCQWLNMGLCTALCAYLHLACKPGELVLKACRELGHKVDPRENDALS